VREVVSRHLDDLAPAEAGLSEQRQRDPLLAVLGLVDEPLQLVDGQPHALAVFLGVVIKSH